jgi:hypothetical protein
MFALGLKASLAPALPTVIVLSLNRHDSAHHETYRMNRQYRLLTRSKGVMHESEGKTRTGHRIN